MTDDVLAAAEPSGAYPVLLGPVRLEVHFTDTHLLVRIFPDEWAIDKFEDKLTAAEVEVLDAYWTALWRAGGDRVAEEAAWHELVARIPAGRATWLLTQHEPANPADRPSVPAGTTVLAVVTPQPVAANDRQPTVDYWTAVWRARGDRGAVLAADLALLAAVGATRAGAIRARRPVGLTPVPAGATDAVAVAFLVLPPMPAERIRPKAWTQPARATLLPDRFQVIGYVGGRQVFSEPAPNPVREPLLVSPDPAATEDKDKPKINEETGELRVPPALTWLTNFDEAVNAGMGVRIPLKPAFHQRVDRLVVLGLRQKSGPEQTAAELGTLITNQLRSPNGYSILPQGTPTNNTEQAPAGRGEQEEAEAARRSAFGVSASGWRDRSDGRWFAELLGLDPAVLTGMPGADGTDQREARAANTALWPATWGSYLKTTLHPIISDDVAAQTRDFFVRHVSGRGPIPAVRIGRQPYGILPTTSFKRMTWPDTATHRRGLAKLLDAATEDWTAAASRVEHLGRAAGTADPHQRLLDILALQPTSAEYHQRYAMSVADLYNRENLRGGGPQVVTALTTLDMAPPVLALLARLGYPADAAHPRPDLLDRLFTDVQQPLLGPLVGDRPLSETDPLPDEENYLRRLAEFGRTDLERIRLEDGFGDGTPPAALLYLLLRHGVLLGWAEAARRLAGLPAPSPDPLFLQITGNLPAELRESRYLRLYSPDAAITGSPAQLVREFLPSVIGTHPATTELAGQLEAIAGLAAVPTARLERLLAEHLDCATYRLDAWRLGLVTERLTELRYGPDGTAPPKRGLQLGAYGWLENIERRDTTKKPLVDVPLTGDLATLFKTTTAQRDPDNGGYVHAPSPSHATTAAVLRAGHLANRASGKQDAFAINLASNRVRTALTLLDGLRQGQSLGALLGYRLERALHDRFSEDPDDPVELDRVITPLRGAFPLRAGRLQDLRPGDQAEIELVEARTVVDGLALVRRATREPARPHYPYGATGLPADLTKTEKRVMDEEVADLVDIHDALADLAVAEGTHQALLGNTDRAAATLDAYSKEGFPPDPAVVRTPRGGATLTHRFGLRLTHGVPPGATPRAMAEPSVDDWLKDLLPARQDVAAVVRWTDPVTGAARQRVVTQLDIGLAPIDLLSGVRPVDQAQLTDLDDRILGVVADQDAPRPDAKPVIHYIDRIENKITFFEASPLIAALRTLLTTARPLRVTDLMPAGGAVDRTVDDAVTVPRPRPAAVRKATQDLRDKTKEYFDDLVAVVAVPAQVLKRIDDLLTGYARLAAEAGRFGMVRSGWGEAILWRGGVYRDLLAAVAAAADRMSATLARATTLIAAYDALPPSTPDSERFRILQQAEALLTTKPAVPRPATPAKLRVIVGNRRQAFTTRTQALAGQAASKKKTLSGLYTDIAALLPLTDFDSTGLDLKPFENRITGHAAELLTRTQALLGDLDARLEATKTTLADYDKAVTGPDRVRIATTALRAMLGEDVLVVPEFTPPAQLDADWKKAVDDSGELVEHLVEAHGRDFPVDDWLHGIARVREKPRLWERVVLLSDALRGPGGLLGDLLGHAEPVLTPVQLPYRRHDHWLGMEFHADSDVTADRLLFTAHYAQEPLLGGDSHCGLLFDEWTEVVPAERETTALAVHYDAPDSEPPQVMLLVTPPRPDGWADGDLLAAVTETFDLARLRAVEPEHLDGTAYAHLLPATILSATRQPITISTDLAVTNLRGKAR
ncbi:hypothetical protein DMA12_24625 [Amycolatopsis balhimycina DSM 5908]|uniref:Uncharacterized protein n=1 Tax=Amycolatopsis balhimycina DSM 5908 TaxID=1081091 RepID=A0A428WDM7_AMYBA|nr:hypothetical protein [Amycolatopsis balhimycina]RSM41195.1 hypothetical protein DMA12_24625 [Amycolatopsis balhimycina DSM 5908]